MVGSGPMTEAVIEEACNQVGCVGHQNTAWQSVIQSVWLALKVLNEDESSIAILNAGESRLGCTCAVSLTLIGVKISQLILYDGRYFQETKWWTETEAQLLMLESVLMARGCALTARREPKSVEGLVVDVVARSPSVILSDDAEGSATLRAVRCYERLATTRACGAVVSRPRTPACLLAHAAKDAVYAPLDNYQFSAREVRDATDRDARWASHLRRALARVSGADVEATYAVTAAPRRRRFVETTPLVWFVPEQLDFIKRCALALMLPTDSFLSLKPSTAARYVHGGYADYHYVTSAPDPHEICFELLAKTGEAVGFIAFKAEQFSGLADWPFALPERRFDVCTVTRFVIKPPWRGTGASEYLLRASDLFHTHLGMPVRITTRKEEVALKVLGRSPLLAKEDAPRRKRLEKLAADAYERTLALVPFAPKSDSMLATPCHFQTRTPVKPKSRGNNLGWTFWYVGTDVRHCRDGLHYSFVGGRQRFARVSEP